MFNSYIRYRLNWIWHSKNRSCSKKDLKISICMFSFLPNNDLHLSSAFFCKTEQRAGKECLIQMIAFEVNIETITMSIYVFEKHFVEDNDLFWPNNLVQNFLQNEQNIFLVKSNQVLLHYWFYFLRIEFAGLPVESACEQFQNCIFLNIS